MWPFAKYISVFPLVFLSLDLHLKGTVGLMNHRSSPSLSALFIVAWSTLLKGVECASKEEIERHLELGKKFLAAGQMADALSQYHAAIEGDPSNYMSYFRRATVYLAMGKSKAAIPDLDKVIELKPDFVAARMQRGNVWLKQGKLDDAHIDYEQVLQKEPSNAAAQEHIGLIEPLKHDIQAAANLKNGGDFQGAIDLLGRAIEHCPWDPRLREIRADCYIAQGDFFKAIGDIRPTTKLRSDNTAGYFKLSMLHYQMGESDESLTEIRECLKLDPDHKDCFPHYKKVKKLVKQIQSVFSFINEQRWDDCLSKANQILQTEPKVLSYVHRAHGQICHCHSKAGHVEEAMESCSQILARDENDIDALCDRADAYIANEQFQEAIEDFKKATNIYGDHHRAKEGLHRAEKLLKQSQKRDYYKILGVKRNAGKKEILKAYRKLAVQWHPDKYDGDNKKKAEKMFLDIASAKEVLTDPEKRQKFDNGEDPLDPEEQANSHHHWHQGFDPFGGGGFQFKFHFG